MLTLITCPTCMHKFTVPESSMGQRRTCPNCEAIFVAGKSVAEPNGRINGEPRRGLLERAANDAPAARPPLDKTMLGETAAMIRYNCPRCKKALEAQASEAGVKKPCPECGGRLQVPNQPPSSAPAFDPLNKTILAESTPAPHPSTPVYSTISAANPALADKPAAAALSPWKKYAAVCASAAVAGLVVLYFVGKHNAEVEHARLLENHKHELEMLKADIAQKTATFQQQQALEAQQRRAWEEQKAKQEARQRELDRERDNELRRLATLNDEKQAADARARLEQKQRELEDERRSAQEQRARSERETRDQLDALRRQLDNANNQRATIIQPPIVHPWWYNRYYPW